MSSRESRIYHSGKPVKTIITIVLSVAFALLLAAVIIFFSFRKYIVYTSDGVRLDVPWLEGLEDTVE